MFEQGRKVWWYDQRYLTGYAGLPVRAVFVTYRKSKIRTAGIAVLMRNGEWKPKWVAPESVKPRD